MIASTTNPMSVPWRLLRPAGLEWRCWNGHYIVFDPFSGMTHYLDATAGAVLEVLLDGPADAPAVAAELAALDGAPALPVLEAAVRQTLERFDEIGLAEPAP